MGDTNSLRQKPPIAADRTMYTQCGPLRVPLDLREWFSEDKLVTWIKEAMAGLGENPELKEAVQLATSGRAAKLASMIILGCTTQYLSSEDIAKACRSEKPYQELCGSEAPFPEELEQFRRNHRSVLQHALTAVMLRAVKERYPNLEKIPPGVEYSIQTRAVDRLDTVRNMDTREE